MLVLLMPTAVAAFGNVVATKACSNKKWKMKEKNRKSFDMRESILDGWVQQPWVMSQNVTTVGCADGSGSDYPLLLVPAHLQNIFVRFRKFHGIHIVDRDIQHSIFGSLIEHTLFFTFKCG